MDMLLKGDTTMFKFDKGQNSHMPFSAHGTDEETREFCCLQIDGKWKIHEWRDGAWKRVQTGMPEDATECSPFAEYHPDTDRWSLTFIAGGAHGKGNDFMRFALYQINDIEDPYVQRVLNADAGFAWKGILFHAGRVSGIDIEYRTYRRHIDLKGTEYIYRLTQNADHPQELLVTGQMPDGNVFTWAIDMEQKTVDELTEDGEPLYKPCVIFGDWYTAKRLGGFEEREIRLVGHLRRRMLRWDDCLEFSEEQRGVED